MSDVTVKIHPFSEVLEKKLFGFGGVPYIEQKRMVSRAIKAAVAEYNKLRAELASQKADLEASGGLILEELGRRNEALQTELVLLASRNSKVILELQGEIAELQAKNGRMKAYERFYKHIRKCVDEKYTDCNHVICAICEDTFEQITRVSEQALKGGE